MEKFRLLVVGAGALGCLYAAILSSVGHRVSLLGRLQTVEAVRSRGLKVHGKLNLEVEVEEAAEAVDKLRSPDGFDLVLLAVKAYQVAEAAVQVAPVAAVSGSPVLCLQNGLGVEEEAAEALGFLTPVVRGVSFCGAYVEQPAVVRCTGVGETLIADTPLKALSKFASCLREAGLSAGMKKNMETVVWEKTLVNAGINPFGALTGLRNGELLEAEGIPEAMAETVREGVKVAERKGVRLARDPVKLTFETARATAQNYNSMLQDVKRGKRTEIDYINGALSRLGSLLGVPTPLNKLLTKLVKDLEAGRKQECGVSVILQKAL
ncbi:MAG: 2-dehydropantoate 2-reductase [Candidatus Hecatellales archaeon B24]|nr:MAG: 2-dehydropantoate 2-reductase [Candidatus Hecatellales archaeon B24]